MPRTIWSGAISFGLVTVPIHVVSATEDHSTKFHLYYQSDMGRVRTRKICELEDREVSRRRSARVTCSPRSGSSR